MHVSEEILLTTFVKDTLKCNVIPCEYSAMHLFIRNKEIGSELKFINFECPKILTSFIFTTCVFVNISKQVV